ncbi:hypothetical protein Tco_0276011 [Tanacetum coccineum]
MTTLQFADTHNLVAFLSKPAKSEGFEQIVDFLNANPMRYALTINPTIYTSCIEQFWATIKAKTINEEVQLQALVDGKKVIITESTVRRNLHLKDAEAQEEMGGGSANPTDPHHTPTFTQPSTSQPQKKHKPRNPRKDTKIPQSSGPTDNVADEAVNEEMDDSLERAATTATSLDVEQDMSNTLQSGEDRLKLEELIEICTKLQQRVLDLENTKTAKGQEITSLKRRVKRLENKNRSKTHGLKRLYKVGLSARIESFEDEGLGEEDSSKQGKIDDIDANEDIYLVNVHKDEDMFRVNNLEGDEVIVETEVDHEVVVETEVASKDVNLSVDEVTLAQALAALKSAKPKADKVMLQELEKGTITTTIVATTVTAASTRPKAKGLVIHEEEQATTPTVSSQQPSQVKVQDKDKAQMLAELEEVDRLVRQREEEANIISWDNVQAMIDADYQMAQQMQAEEQEKLSIEEKSKKLFDKAMKRVNTFVDMDTELVEGSEVRAEAEIAQESSSKRAGTELEQESIKKQKVDEDKETAELQRLIEVVPDKEEVAIDAIPLATKPPSIVDYKIHKEGKKTYYQIIRADGSSKMYLVFSHMLKSFDKEDLETLWKLVKAKHGSTRPEEDYRVLDWKIYDSCGVYSLRMRHMHIHMLVEKRYPLTPATISDMLNKKLQCDHFSKMGRIVRIKRLHDDLEVTAAK